MKLSFFDYSDCCHYLVLTNRRDDLYQMLRTIYPDLELYKLRDVIEFLFKEPIDLPEIGDFND